MLCNTQSSADPRRVGKPRVVSRCSVPFHVWFIPLLVLTCFTVVETVVYVLLRQGAVSNFAEFTEKAMSKRLVVFASAVYDAFESTATFAHATGGRFSSYDEFLAFDDAQLVNMYDLFISRSPLDSIAFLRYVKHENRSDYEALLASSYGASSPVSFSYFSNGSMASPAPFAAEYVILHTTESPSFSTRGLDFWSEAGRRDLLQQSRELNDVVVSGPSDVLLVDKNGKLGQTTGMFAYAPIFALSKTYRNVTLAPSYSSSSSPTPPAAMIPMSTPLGVPVNESEQPLIGFLATRFLLSDLLGIATEGISISDSFVIGIEDTTPAGREERVEQLLVEAERTVEWGDGTFVAGMVDLTKEEARGLGEEDGVIRSRSGDGSKQRLQAVGKGKVLEFVEEAEAEGQKEFFAIKRVHRFTVHKFSRMWNIIVVAKHDFIQEHFSNPSSAANVTTTAIIGFTISAIIALLLYLAHLSFQRVAEVAKEHNQRRILHAFEATISYATHELRNPLQVVLGSLDVIQPVIATAIADQEEDEEEEEEEGVKARGKEDGRIGEEGGTGRMVKHGEGVDGHRGGRRGKKSKKDGLDEVLRDLQSAREASQTMVGILNGLSDMEKVASGTVRISLSPVKPRNMVLDIVTSMVRAHGIPVQVLAHGRVPPLILMDLYRVKDILRVFLDSAMTFSASTSTTTSLRQLDTSDSDRSSSKHIRVTVTVEQIPLSTIRNVALGRPSTPSPASLSFPTCGVATVHPHSPKPSPSPSTSSSSPSSSPPPHPPSRSTPHDLLPPPTMTHSNPFDYVEGCDEETRAEVKRLHSLISSTSSSTQASPIPTQDSLPFGVLDMLWPTLPLSTLVALANAALMEKEGGVGDGEGGEGGAWDDNSGWWGLRGSKFSLPSGGRGEKEGSELGGSLRMDGSEKGEGGGGGGSEEQVGRHEPSLSEAEIHTAASLTPPPFSPTYALPTASSPPLTSQQLELVSEVWRQMHRLHSPKDVEEVEKVQSATGWASTFARKARRNPSAHLIAAVQAMWNTLRVKRSSDEASCVPMMVVEILDRGATLGGRTHEDILGEIGMHDGAGMGSMEPNFTPHGSSRKYTGRVQSLSLSLATATRVAAALGGYITLGEHQDSGVVVAKLFLPIIPPWRLVSSLSSKDYANLATDLWKSVTSILEGDATSSHSSVDDSYVMRSGSRSSLTESKKRATPSPDKSAGAMSVMESGSFQYFPSMTTPMFISSDRDMHDAPFRALACLVVSNPQDQRHGPPSSPTSSREEAAYLIMHFAGKGAMAHGHDMPPQVHMFPPTDDKDTDGAITSSSKDSGIEVASSKDSSLIKSTFVDTTRTKSTQQESDFKKSTFQDSDVTASGPRKYIEDDGAKGKGEGSGRGDRGVAKKDDSSRVVEDRDVSITASTAPAPAPLAPALAAGDDEGEGEGSGVSSTEATKLVVKVEEKDGKMEKKGSGGREEEVKKVRQRSRGRSSRSKPALHAHVLCVDDDPNVRRLIVRLVESFGCTTEVLDDGDGVEDLLRRRGQIPGISLPPTGTDGPPFDLILMDIVMVRSDGADITRHLIHDRNVSIPIIAVTANHAENDMNRFRTAGFRGVARKPVDRSALYAAVEAVIAKPKSTAKGGKKRGAKKMLSSMKT